MIFTGVNSKLAKETIAISCYIINIDRPIGSD